MSGCCMPLIILISTHTLRKEGDYIGISSANFFFYFNPHPPQGG